MAKILIGDHFVHPDDIESISERDITMNIEKEKPNPKPKPKGLLGKAFYSSTVTVMEEHKYHILVLKVKPDGPHRLYSFYTICNNPNFLKDAKALKQELDKLDSDWQAKRKAEIMKVLEQLGMEQVPFYGGWINSKHLDNSVMIDKEIKSKQDFIDKYM